MPDEKHPSGGRRREGRELALKLLYREELTGIQEGSIPGLDEARERALVFSTALVEGVREHLTEIDKAIAAASEHWEIGRMGAVDRTILRIGVFELLFLPDNPVAVVINEAVGIARKYSSDECGRFVNGVLDHIAREARGGECATSS
ncbi:transcription antitermination factor NusB [bacterium]|nr:transcription antitermination factor NusB [bacterium]